MDVIDLKEFYRSPLGKVAQQMIADRIMERWKGLTGANILGLGYAVPYLEAWRGDAERLMSFMPARQGVMHWPPGKPPAAALVDEAELPLDDGVVDLALIVHGLELSDQLPDMLGELWRVLSPQGRVLIIVPNRRGMWARFDTTPFGHGRPFSPPAIDTHAARCPVFAVQLGECAVHAANQPACCAPLGTGPGAGRKVGLTGIFGGDHG